MYICGVLVLWKILAQLKIESWIDPIYKSKHGVCLSVVTSRAGQGGQGRHPPTVGHFQLRLEKQQWWCLSVWVVPGRFFQSLPVPCGASSYVIPQM